MTPAWIALSLVAVYLLAVFGVKTATQIRRTGDSGYRGIRGKKGSQHWWAGVILTFAFVVYGGGLVAGLAGMPPISPLEQTWARVLGVVLAIVGSISSLASQWAMGANWRIGVDDTERTNLVTTGLFSVVRNPFFTAMLLTSAGVVLVNPNPVAVASWILLLAGIELQVRLVEEPHLHQQHGEPYSHYLATVGRFVPGLH